MAHPHLDCIVYDYLAEITMSIMARARAKDEARGYATDFVTAAMAPNLAAIAGRGVKIISNAGGVNPEACAAALRAEIETRGLDLTVACVVGDDLMALGDRLHE
ncbi:MAG: acyclic terpene utilization AtuA family protein [Halioglobus sp.]|nr:acyclic terpene utilization AtuA family protein [Halioglobus sp.]